jgi:cytochrome P450
VPFLYAPSRPDFADRAYEIYRELRDDHPVYRNPEDGSYALSRFEDVRAAANDAVRLSSRDTRISTGLLPMMQQLDPPRHDELRSLVQRAFTPRRVAQCEPRVREIALELIDGFVAEGRCDLKRAFCEQLPSRVIGELIGVPPERSHDFLQWTDAMVAAGPIGDAPRHIYAEFAKLLEERRGERRDDLMSALLDAEVDGQQLTEKELLGFCFLLIVAGNDTTNNLLANGAVLSARHPDQRKLLAEEPERIPQAIEEMLRYESPTHALPRRAVADLQFHGVTIPAGAEVLLVWGAANHDEREFDDPERFDVTREIRRHLAFGQGIHHCLGSNLARLEAKVAFEELLGRIPDYRLAQEPRWVTSFWARAYESVQITF